ncbi:MAG: diacylglycerol kinase family lipid kinase, partial [Candidatus Dormibacteraeota bacterium]|nr:diacylglycerol kinase family lipid kinase [Candidatus Dormibacteraeota bacterium]
MILNEDAGSKGGIPTNLSSTEPVRDALARRGLGDALVLSRTPDEARELTRAAVRDGYDLVVAAGGDGTIGLVAGELLGTETALGILPLGSVMNIPRMLGLPREVEAAADVLLEGSIRPIDVGLAKGRIFYEAGSVGMNAAMFREAQRFDRGDYLSVIRAVWVAIRYRPARMRIELDDGLVETRALMVMVANGPYTGVGMTVAPEARLDDGKFDVRVFRHFSKAELLRHLFSIAFGRRAYSPHIETHRSARVRIDSASPLPCRADSHDLGTTPVEFV